MNATRTTAGKVDQIFACTLRRRPDPRLNSSIVPPNGILYVRGWILGNEGATPAVTIEDGPLTYCTIGNARPDVTQALGVPETPASEFETFVDVPPLPDGSYRLALVSISGERSDTLDRVEFRLFDPRARTTLAPTTGGQVNIDRIRVGATELERHTRALGPNRDELIRIDGWAINGIEMRAGVALYAVIDDHEALPAAYAGERTDVAAEHHSPEVLYSGFRFVFDPSPYAAGTHLIRFVVVMPDGSAHACGDSLAFSTAD